MRPILETIRQTLDFHIMTPAVEDAETADRHFRFLVRQLVLGIIGLSAFPIWLVLGAPGSAFATITFFWLLAPLAIAAFVLRTGRLEIGRLMSAFVLTGLVLWICTMTGGLASPLAMFFAVVPLAAHGENSGQSIRPQVAVALAGVGLGAIFDVAGLAGNSANFGFSVIGFAVAVTAVLGVGLWSERSRRPVGPEHKSAPQQPFFQLNSPYNQPGSEVGSSPAPALANVAHFEGSLSVGRIQETGQVIPLTLPVAPPEPTGGYSRFQETGAREVRNRA